MLKSIAVDINFGGAQEPFKLEVPDLQGDINVLIGQNGVGKTMLLTCTWFAGFLLQTYQVSLAVSPSSSDTLFGKTAEDVLAMTFNNPEELSGMFVFKGHQQTPFEFILAFEKGKLVNFNIELETPEAFASIKLQPVMFNSKEARMFTSYERYLEILKMADIGTPRTIDDFKKVSRVHKLYDIMWFEHVRIKFKIWEREGYSEKARSIITDFHTNWPSEHDAFGSNPVLYVKEGVPWIKSDSINKKLSAFGSGHQAVLMTTLFL